MKRKEFVRKGLAAGALIGSSSLVAESKEADQTTQKELTGKLVPRGYDLEYAEVRIERSIKGQPHKGKVLMAIQPHSDDIPLSAGGLVAKLLDEGYTGYLCSVSDDARGQGTYTQNRIDNQNIADYYGMKGSIELLCPHHQMDSINIQDLKQRFIFLFRAYKVDTIVCMDPWGHYEENPDHFVTGLAVEAARWMAGSKDYPEHFFAGFGPHVPREVYFYSRAHETDNLIVDISDYMDKKIEVNLLNVAKGPAGNNGIRLRDRLAREGRKLSILDGEDFQVNFNYVKTFLFSEDKTLGAKYGLEYAEGFHYKSWLSTEPSPVQVYIDQNAIPL
jgi:LmbE family N-acetylglucosaminyl deacetylase